MGTETVFEEFPSVSSLVKLFSPVFISLLLLFEMLEMSCVVSVSPQISFFVFLDFDFLLESSSSADTSSIEPITALCLILKKTILVLKEKKVKVQTLRKGRHF